MRSCCSRVAGPGGDWSLSRKVPREDCGKLGVEVYLWAAAGGRAGAQRRHGSSTGVFQFEKLSSSLACVRNYKFPTVLK